MPLSHDDIEAIATRAAQEAIRAAAAASLTSADIKTLVAEAVKQTLVQLGIDHSNPFEMQQDFQHLRAWRKAGQDLKVKTLLTLVGIFITGLIGLVILGLRVSIKP